MNKFIKFCFNWGVMYLLNISLTWLFDDFLKLQFFLSYAIVMLIMSIYWFISSSLFVFKKNMKKGLYLKYFLAIISFSLLNYLLVTYFYSTLTVNKYLLIFIILWLVTILKFFIYDKLVFNSKKW